MFYELRHLLLLPHYTEYRPACPYFRAVRVRFSVYIYIYIYIYIYSVAYRLVAKWWLCKRWPLLCNARNIYVRSNRTKGLCNQFLSNGSINTFPQKPTRTRQQKSCVIYVIRVATVAMQRHGKHASWTLERMCFLHCRCRGVNLETTSTTVQPRV
jgi:hypothetical protein